MGVETVKGASGEIRAAIASAATATGIDFSYLMTQAKLESGFNPTIRASTSSATGLYQFLDSSWLGEIKLHGGEIGLGWAANAITLTKRSAYVADPATRQAILDLRKNPAVAALIAAKSAQDNKAFLGQALSRPINNTDLYMGHFLGPAGARTFLTAMAQSPDRIGAAMFPAAAAANRSLFYNKDGTAKTLGQIYNRFAAKLAQGAGTSVPDLPALTPAVTAPTTPELKLDDAVVLAGKGEDSKAALAWARAALAQVNSVTPTTDTGGNNSAAPGFGNTFGLGNEAGLGSGNALTLASLMRPTPQSARLAYLMLATLGS